MLRRDSDGDGGRKLPEFAVCPVSRTGLLCPTWDEEPSSGPEHETGAGNEASGTLAESGSGFSGTAGPAMTGMACLDDRDRTEMQHRLPMPRRRQ